MIAQSWRPNWRDAREYPVTLSEAGWRWEFIRRCPEYQDDFSRYRSTERAKDFAHLPCPDGVASWEEHFASVAHMPGALEKYGMHCLVDPAHREPPIGPFPRQYPLGVSFASEAKRSEMQSDGLFLMAFNLKLPLAPQIEKARTFLERVQQESGKPQERRGQRKKWSRYLRILDAKAAGATALEIARVLDLQPRAGAEGFDPDRLVAENYRQALALQLRFKAPP